MMGEGASAKETTLSSSQHVILFYKYHPLSADREITKIYRCILEKLCRALDLKGRILIGYSKREGINGTLAGLHDNVRAFTYALLGSRDKVSSLHSVLYNAVTSFWSESKSFFRRISEPELQMDCPKDFKWSQYTEQKPLFPDLNIKLVTELIGTGGILSSISLDETGKGYLNPKEWKEEVLNSSVRDTVIIDCRNTKEYQIGRFENAIDPKTTTFSQFPRWVKEHGTILRDKKILMYCTGGIRCEKASAYIRKEIPSVKSVQHLQGGIHKYLEEFGGAANDIWKGKNFVFDGRQAASGEEIKLGKDQQTEVERASYDDQALSDTIGKCVNCSRSYDCFDPHCVCTVCREPCLVCQNCQDDILEYHCVNHLHLKTCYFTDLRYFDKKKLNEQRSELLSHFEGISIGRRFRQKRKTLLKQIARIDEHIMGLGEDINDVENAPCRPKCRNCSTWDCSGDCWGFHGLKRKEIRDQRATVQLKYEVWENAVATVVLSKTVHPKKKARQILQINSELRLPSSAFRDPDTGIRAPPNFTRILNCFVKAKWCGHSIVDMVTNEFPGLSKPGALEKILEHGLLRLNDRAVSLLECVELQLKPSDIVSRVIHWHEAPVIVPEKIIVTKIQLHALVAAEYGLNADSDAAVYVCNKPSSVPVHPAGPFLSNSLTIMVEAQVGLQCGSLKPVHRTDRVTSGLTLCCKSSAVARIFHRCLSEGTVDKLYVARVHGKFPSTNSEMHCFPAPVSSSCVSWRQKHGVVEVDAAVHTLDPANGVRIVDSAGKPSKSVFKLVDFNQAENVSVIACQPITGRNHQLRVHLQMLGYPIVNDTQYGGLQSEASQMNDRAIELLMRAGEVERNEGASPSLLHESEISLTVNARDTYAARAACRCCEGRVGIMESFTPSQLLHSGHSIDLHALKYTVNFPQRKKCAKQIVPLPSLSFEVDGPSWATEKAISAVVWLEG